MMRICFTFFLIWLSLWAGAQQMIEGRVVDRETGKPVSFASVGVVGTAKGTSTNAEGAFSLSVSAPFTLRITCVGYESAQVQSQQEAELIQLKPIATQLREVVVTSRPVNPQKVVRKAFAAVNQNYGTEAFLQKFFYRHYCLDGDTYGRLIEAFVDVWRQNGYKSFRSEAGQREDLRISQLRRSLDQTAVAQGHEPIAVAGTLLADLVAYQATERSNQLNFYTGLSNLRIDFIDYSFSFEGITSYDGDHVYEIRYQYKKDTMPGPKWPGATGTLYITTDTYAIVRAEEVRFKSHDTVRTSVYYRKYNNRYYPYHLVRDGGTYASGKRVHWFHIDMTSVEISEDPARQFKGALPSKEEMLQIPYDSAYWNHQSILKATPLETQIIQDLGGGKSLSQQFILYQQYEYNTRNGGEEAKEKIDWLLNFYKNQKPVVLCYWQSDPQAKFLIDLELFKRLNSKYRNHAVFVMVAMEDDQVLWEEWVRTYHLSIDGLLQYRLGGHNKNNEPLVFRLIDQHGKEVVLPGNNQADLEAKLISLLGREMQ